MNIISSILAFLGIKHNVSSLNKASADAVDVFNKTINKLAKVNEKAEETHAEKQKTIDKLQSEQALLKTIRENNQKVISKIGKIFE